MILYKLFWTFRLIIFALCIAVNEANSKLSQTSKIVINFQRKILILKEFQVPLKNISSSSTFLGVQRLARTLKHNKWNKNVPGRFFKKLISWETRLFGTQ